MTDLAAFEPSSPFDHIRHIDADGEHWFARELMALMGYSTWERFAAVVAKAAESLAVVQGDDQAAANFRKIAKVTGSRGPAAADVRLTRFAAYLTAMAGDDTKEQVAGARVYFAVKTREAEVAPARRELTRLELIDMARESEVARIQEAEARQIAEAKVAELAPAAQAWHDIAGAEGSWSVGDSAQMLCSAGIMTGRTRLFAQLDELGWTYLQGNERHIKQTALEAGLLVPRAYAPRYKPNGERIQMQPQIRVTGKGLDRLVRDLGSAA